jgi:hypothetical protein
MDAREAWEAELSTRVFSPSEKEELKHAVVERLREHEMKTALLEVEEKIRREQQWATLTGLRQLYARIRRMTR